MAHLHAILATESPFAVLIKRGPGRCSGILRWDRRSDTFEHGQWLKQKLKLKRQTPTLERSLPGGWILQQVHGCGSGNLPNQGISFQSFALVPPDAEPIPMPTWEWADFDTLRRRLVWTAGCTLFAAPWTHRGLGETQSLLDTNGVGFESKQAPY